MDHQVLIVEVQISPAKNPSQRKTATRKKRYIAKSPQPHDRLDEKKLSTLMHISNCYTQKRKLVKFIADFGPSGRIIIVVL